MDSRVIKHAETLVNWSTSVSEGDMVLIRAYPEAHDLVVAITGEIAKRRAGYMILMENDEALRTYLEYADDTTLSLFPRQYKSALEESDVVILITAPNRIDVLAESDSEKLALRSKTRKPLFDLMMSKRWCDTLHPCYALAKQAGMSLEEYRDFVYNAILIDWNEISKEMSILRDNLNRFKDIHIIGPETDLYAETAGRSWMMEDGKHNMPSGEVYTSPLEDSVEGRVYFDIPFLYQGNIIEGVRLRFEKGSVVEYSAERGEQTLKSILNVDPGSSRLGEIAIGMNRGIKKHSMTMLFDEKMGDTIHCALGKALGECNGTNDSAIHVDMIKSMHKGKIVAGSETIYNQGEFVY